MPPYPSIFFFFKFLYQILFSYICYQIIRLVGLFGIGEPEQKVEFQTEMFLYVFFVPFSSDRIHFGLCYT